jgi:hypothetical protein
MTTVVNYKAIGDYPLDWRLGFVRDGYCVFFKDDPKDVYGDDWNDAPASCNAGQAHEEFERFSVYTDGPLAHNEGRPYYSAQEYNSEQPPAPWLCTSYDPYEKTQNIGVYGRTTFLEFLVACGRVGQRVLMPVEAEISGGSL